MIRFSRAQPHLGVRWTDELAAQFVDAAEAVEQTAAEDLADLRRVSAKISTYHGTRASIGATKAIAEAVEDYEDAQADLVRCRAARDGDPRARWELLGEFLADEFDDDLSDLASEALPERYLRGDVDEVA